MKCIIVGAGTSGLITARELAHYGVEAEVYERKKAIKVYTSSGILSLNGLRELHILYKDALLNELFGARLFFGNTVIEVKAKEAKAYSVDRNVLNKKLMEEAKGSGAEIFYGEGISKEKLREISKNKENIIIGADGAVSNVASFFGFPPIKKFILTYRMEYRVRKEDDGFVELFFDNKVTKGLFGWIAPHGDNTEIGVGVDERFGKSSDALRLFLMRKEVKEAIRNARPLEGGANIIPISLRKRFVDEEKRVLLVGDAAGQVKSSTGGGIIFGGHAAMIASKVVKDYLDNNASLAAYQSLWLKEFKKEIIIHNIIHTLYSSLSNSMLNSIASLAKLLGLEKLLSEHGDMDRPSKIIRSMLGLKT